MSPLQLALSAQESWRESDKSQVREGRAPAVKKPFSLRCGCGLGAPAPRAALEHVAVMQQTIEHGADGGDIAEQLAPVLDRAVGSEQRADALVAAHDDFQQILGGGVRQFAHAEVVDDEQRDRGHRFHVFSARAVGDSFGQLIEQDVGFAVQHFVALLDGGLADGLRQVAFARSAGTKKQRVFALADERGGGQIEDQAAIHFRD